MAFNVAAATANVAILYPPNATARIVIIPANPLKWSIAKVAMLINVSPNGANWSFNWRILPSSSCIGVVVSLANCCPFPDTSSNVSPTLLKAFANVRFASSPIVPNAVADIVSACCWLSHFVISLTILSITCFWVAPPFCHSLNVFCVSLLKEPIASPIVPSANLVVTSLIASFTLSKLYAPLSAPFFSNWK